MGDPNHSTNGDTNYERNPSNVSMFDLGTFVFFVIGLICLGKYNKKLLWIILIFALVPLVNDLFVIEKIPEAMHPYGVGHPNTLRIASIIPIIYFTVAYGLSRLQKLLNVGEINLFYASYLFLVVIAGYNWYIYFQQPSDTYFSAYIDKFNGATTINMANLINRSGVSEAAVTPTIATDDRFRYFIKHNIKIHTFTPKNYDDAVSIARKNQFTVYDPTINTQLAIQLLSQDPPQGIEIDHLSESLADPDHTVYAIVMVKTQ